MKKILSATLSTLLIIGCILSLASCVLSVGPMTLISGKYKGNILVADATYEFSPLGSVTLTVDPILGTSSTYEGKYKVNEDTEEITFTFDSEDADAYEGTFDFTEGEESGVKYVKIGLVKYTEVE